MLLNEIAILNLGSETERDKRNADKYLDLVKGDKQLINKVKTFLNDLKSNKDLQQELMELKKLRYQKAHILAQKQLTNTFIVLKSVNNLVKKVQHVPKDTIPLASLLECVKVYVSGDIDYKGVIDSISGEIEQTPDVIKNNDKLRDLVNDLKGMHEGVHMKVREVLIRHGIKQIESFDLPLKKKVEKVSLNPEDTEKLKTLLGRIVEFADLEKKLSQQLKMEVPKINIASEIYLNKLFVSIDYHFLSKTELNAVDKPEWMVNFIEEALIANVDFLMALNLNPEVFKTLISSFLDAFYVKLGQRFEQDSSVFLEHQFLFTNFLVCLNAHNAKVTNALEQKGVELEDWGVYDLSRIYQGKSQYLEKMIAGELQEFEDLIFEKIDQMEIVTKDVPDKPKFDIALAETLENFVLLYNKNLLKYNATSGEFISQFVKQNMLDKAVQSLVKVLKKVIHDTEDASLAARFYIMDSIMSVSEYTYTQLQQLEEFDKAGKQANYDEEFNSIPAFVRETLKEHLNEFWKQITKSLKGFLNLRTTLNAFSSTEPVNEGDLLSKDPIPAVKSDLSEYIATTGRKLQEPYSSEMLAEFLDLLNQFILNKILKEYKFTNYGLRFIKFITLGFCEEFNEVRPQMYKNQEKKMEEIIRFAKSDKNVQFQLCQKLNSIDDTTQPEETKNTKKITAIQGAGYYQLKPKEILVLYDTHIII